MGETEKNLQAALTKFGEISKQGIGRARESIMHSSHLVRTKLELGSLEREKKRLIAGLGEEVFEAISSGKLRSKLFDETIGNIKDIDNKIESKEADLSTAEEEPDKGEPATSKAPAKAPGTEKEEDK